jgi:TatA/E family protein of Tat protein translocase
MGSLGMPEILIILVIALIVFGPRKLPELGKSLGKSLAQFRRASEDFKRQWEDEVAIERQRIEAPAPARYEPSHPTTESADNNEIQSSAAEESIQTQTSTETPVPAQHDETAVQETKRDWM